MSSLHANDTKLATVIGNYKGCLNLQEHINILSDWCSLGECNLNQENVNLWILQGNELKLISVIV